MASFFQRFQESIKNLNQVDVGAQFSKLKAIKIEDLRNISFTEEDFELAIICQALLALVQMVSHLYF